MLSSMFLNSPCYPPLLKSETALQAGKNSRQMIVPFLVGFSSSGRLFALAVLLTTNLVRLQRQKTRS